jgi:hypothetical protein
MTPDNRIDLDNQINKEYLTTNYHEDLNTFKDQIAADYDPMYDF